MKAKLMEAIDRAGGQTALARKLGIKQGHIGSWVHRFKKAPPAEYVLKIESITGISRHDLRPDVFGEQPTKAEEGK
ncbi:hypothetical protein B9T11_07960 [Wohlfahrtiimonas chitiniclastica]|uniref:transcriptional regulator n=1 Tax=Wohlfahrtiimonas chitiniclastica TaxID=400946 RepID=UPI000B98AF84|nr:YdaS family helix-turn-helix protein [Wohlfahrtiimonas chitiniclastica]MBS7818678.1 helix-turn-helix domain-containing protein [Wohlfahrtiimonas chitiniclastica]OYQ79162.1 hypothetical protein B9T11_07960 [Wohlfahrtiimonas chitiniclastica]